MTDAAGQEIKAGDIVLFATMGSTRLNLGFVEKVTPKGVRATYVDRLGRCEEIKTAVKPREAFARVADISTKEVKALLKDIVQHQLDKHLG